ncbi:MAG: hypothetical protein AB8B87_20670 [Granulosicoccus sp.]
MRDFVHSTTITEAVNSSGRYSVALRTLWPTSSEESSFTVNAGKKFRIAGLFALTGLLPLNLLRATIEGDTETPLHLYFSTKNL